MEGHWGTSSHYRTVLSIHKVVKYMKHFEHFEVTIELIRLKKLEKALSYFVTPVEGFKKV